MSDVLEVEFLTTPRVERLMWETFTQAELCDAFGAKESQIVYAVTRLAMFLVSEPKPCVVRKFHYLDALALLVFVNLDKYFRDPSARKTLVKEVSHLLFGEQMTPAEAAQRRAELAAEHDRARKSASNHAKFSGRMFRTHQARREEIRRDPWTADPLWWSRNANQHFILFGCANHQILTGLFDKRDSLTIPLEPLAEMGVGCWVNATELFCRADAKLVEIIERREAN